MADAPRVAFLTLGCKVNQAESDAIAGELADAAGTAAGADADVVVINTCTVTAEADRKARKAVRHALGLPGRPTVVVTGCLAGVDPGALTALGDRVIVEADKSRVAERVRDAAGIAPADVRSARGAVVTGRTRAQVKIEDGCDGVCTYCIVPRARGVPRAVPLDEIVSTVESHVRGGIAEVVLTGINIGRYEYGGARLPEVIAAVAATGVSRIRLSSIEPGDVDADLLEACRTTPAFCSHLHIPLQAGADPVLERMGRPYDTREYARVVAAAREALPGLAVSTDVIAGFPGESDAEADSTLQFVEQQCFSRLHVFRYSRRPKTPAAAMSAQVPPAAIATRARALREAGARAAVAAASAREGSVAEVLVERVRTDGPGGTVVAEGVTREYLRVRVRVGAASAGTLLHVRVGRAAADGTCDAVLLDGGDAGDRERVRGHGAC